MISKPHSASLLLSIYHFNTLDGLKYQKELEKNVGYHLASKVPCKE